jgi:hypothetical protein
VPICRSIIQTDDDGRTEISNTDANIGQRGSPRLVKSSREDYGTMVKSTSNAIPLHEVTEADYRVGDQDDRNIADRIKAAMAEVQEALDRAVLAGLIVEPKFTHIENRLAQCGARIDSFVCQVGIYRKLA